jgi:hypothetical protein
MDIAAGFIVALLLGGMAFFSFVFSPLVFIKLPIETAGPFIRAVFPWYFLVVAILFALAVPLTLAQPVLAGALAFMALLGVINRQSLMPRINRLRDRMIAGDTAAGPGFDRLHRASVGINLVQIVVAAGALYALLV